VNCPFRFQKCYQHFIGTHDKTVSVAMRIYNPDLRPSRSTAETQPGLQPASWRLSAMIFQYLMGVAAD